MRMSIRLLEIDFESNLNWIKLLPTGIGGAYTLEASSLPIEKLL